MEVRAAVAESRSQNCWFRARALHVRPEHPAAFARRSFPCNSFSLVIVLCRRAPVRLAFVLIRKRKQIAIGKGLFIEIFIRTSFQETQSVGFFVAREGKGG